MAEEKRIKNLATASFGQFPTNVNAANPWNFNVDKMSFDDNSQYEKLVKDCRFFYRHDPLASTVINKVVDMAINGLVVKFDDIQPNKTEKSIFNAVEKDMIPFLRTAAFEYLITGMVVPEMKFTRIGQKELRDKHIGRLDSILYPTSLWLRDSATIEIKRPLITEKESYYLKIPDEVIHFVMTGGKYDFDADADIELYREIVKLYPDFVKQIKAGKTKILLDNPLVIKSNALPDYPYPIPYLFPALEALKHKRNLRRMDYAVAARVITAILHVKVGNDEYPLTEDQKPELDDLENKFKWRQSLTAEDVERVFALFTNHTVEIDWIFPEVTALLDDKKYYTVNQDIFVALGFPRILITGETERSFSSDPQIATLSPIHTMTQLQNKLLPIAEKVFIEMKNHNKAITILPKLYFKPVNLMSMQLFFTGLKELYGEGNLSRKSRDEAYGFEFRDEMEQRASEKILLEELGVDEFAPVPHSNVPGKEETSTTSKDGNITTKTIGPPKKEPDKEDENSSED
jgi:hypothetical protein